MMLKKTWGLLLILALMATMMIGCGGTESNQQQSEQTPSQQVEITIDPYPLRPPSPYWAHDNNSVKWICRKSACLQLRRK